MQQSAPSEPKDKDEYKIKNDEKIFAGCNSAACAYWAFCADGIGKI